MNGSGRPSFPAFWPAVAWTVLILAAVALPGRALPDAAFRLDKVAHFVLFGGFSWLWLRAAPDAWRRIVLVGLAYGILTEIGQAVAGGGRTGDPMDVAANVLGLVAGMLAYFLRARLPRSDRRGD